MHRPGRRELLNGIRDPAPHRCGVVIASAASSLARAVLSPDVDLRYHADNNRPGICYRALIRLPWQPRTEHLGERRRPRMQMIATPWPGMFTGSQVILPLSLVILPPRSSAAVLN